MDDQIRALVVALSTYSSPYNDGPLEQLGSRVGALTAVSGDVNTLWGGDNCARSGTGYEVRVLPLRCARSIATTHLVGLDELAEAVQPNVVHIQCEPWQEVARQSVKLAHRLGARVGMQLAETGPLLRGLGGAIRRVRGSRVLNRCDYAVGWSSASTRVAEQLAPGIRTATFPATGVAVSADGRIPVKGSPVEWFGAGSAELPKLAFLGRFVEEKGVVDFLEVCDTLASRFPVRAALAGGQGMNERVQEWADERPWAFVHGIVSRTRAASLLAAADVVVCPSRTTPFWEEQFSRVAVEAMGVGTPVFAYDCCALREVVGDGGVVVPEGAREELADGLASYFAGSEQRRVALAQAARGQAGRFTDDVIADHLIDLWSAPNGPST